MVIKSFTTITEAVGTSFTITDPRTLGSPYLPLSEIDLLAHLDRVTIQAKVLNVKETKKKKDVVILLKASLVSGEMTLIWLLQTILIRVLVNYYSGKHTLTYPQSGASIETIEDLAEIQEEQDEDEGLRYVRS